MMFIPMMDTGTHDIQNIVIKSCFDEDTNSNGFHMLGDFINGTDAIGILIMGHSTNQTGLDVHYFSMVAHLSQDHPLSIQTFLSGFFYDDYNVSFFVVEKNGLPIRQPATLLKTLKFLTIMNECGNSTIGYKM